MEWTESRNTTLLKATEEKQKEKKTNKTGERKQLRRE